MNQLCQMARTRHYNDMQGLNTRRRDLGISLNARYL